MNFNELPAQVQQNLRAGFTLVEHHRPGDAEPHVHTAKLNTVRGQWSDGAGLMHHFCHHDSCFDVFPESQFAELEVEGMPEPSTNGVHLTFDPTAFTDAMEAAIAATAETIAAINEQTVVALQAKLRSLYVQALANGDSMVQVVLTQLMFMAENGGQDADSDLSAFEEFVGSLAGETFPDPAPRPIEVIEKELRELLQHPAWEVMADQDRLARASRLIKELMAAKDAAEQCYVFGCRDATGPDDLHCELHRR